MNKLQRILCMVLTAILLLTWMPSSLAEATDGAAPETEVTAEIAEGTGEEEPEIEVEFPD